VHQQDMSTQAPLRPRPIAGPARGLIALLVVPAVWCAACDSKGPAATGSGPGGSQPPAATSAQQAKRIDACSMVAPQDISSLLGVTVAGVSTGTRADMGDCTWTNTTTDESVTLNISNPGTAPNNTLPKPPPGVPDPTTPGPDGMRYLGYGEVEFAAGDRKNSVQVAVLRIPADQARAEAVKLARQIAPQVPR
jgi:hypothetical protein